MGKSKDLYGVLSGVSGSDPGCFMLRFMVLFIYLFIFFSFVYDQTINTWKMLRILFSLLYVKYIFFSFYGSVGFEENKYAKKGIPQLWNALELQVSLSVRDKLCKFISPEATVINLFAILQVFGSCRFRQLK